MEQILKLDIKFSKVEAVYFPGEKVEGIVCIELRQPIRVEEIYIDVCGELSTRRATVLNAVVPSLGRSVRLIVNNRQVLIRSSEVRGTRLEMDFAFALPPDCPQSLECSPLVEMRYFAELVARLPSASSKERIQLSTRQLFTVLEERPPADVASVSQPDRLTVSRPAGSALMCFCGGDEGYVEAQLNLRKTYYVPGEDVTASILIDNQSSHTLRRVSYSVRQVIRRTLTSTPDERLTSRSRLLRALFTRTVRQVTVIGSQDVGPVAASGLARHRHCKLHLPAVPCTSSGIGDAGSRRHIDVAYVFQLRVYLPCCRRHLVVSSPFVVGTLPLPTRNPLIRTDVTNNGKDGASAYPSAFVESARGPIAYQSLSVSRAAAGLLGRRLGVMCVYTPKYLYFPTISCVPKPGTPSTLRSILKPRNAMSTSSGANSSIFSDTLSTTTSYVSDSLLNIHFESPV